MSKETHNNTPVSVEPVVTLNGAQLLQALDFIAPDRDTDPQQLECELTISFADGPAGSGYYCYCTDYPDEGAIMLDAEAPAAPVAAQSDVTQQTLDDVMAGIPARDAEIEALCKQVETLQAQLVDRSTEMQRNLVDESPKLQSQKQPVSGADGLAIELQGISEAIGNGGGVWRSCSGCHELNDGMATGPFSKTLKCHLGVGCSECGGIGAIWDTTDYDAMADFMAAKDQQNVENTETVVCLCNASQGKDADKVDAWRSDDVDLHAALSAEFSKHPQTKPVIGREALVLRCVRAAIDAARKEQA